MLLAGALAVATIASPGAAAAQTEGPTTTVVADDVPGLGEIIGSPDAGPKPTDAGDRGGAAQLALAAILLGGVSFILVKIFREVQGSQSDASDPV